MKRSNLLLLVIICAFVAVLGTVSVAAQNTATPSPVPVELATLPDFADGRVWGLLIAGALLVLGSVAMVKPELKRYTADNRVIYFTALVIGLLISIVGAYGFKAYPFGKDAISLFLNAIITATLAGGAVWVGKSATPPNSGGG